MGRKLREHASGVAFHITARTLGHWFTPRVVGHAEQIVLDGVATSDATLLAHIVMTNHFHIVMRSGIRPLGWIMQPIMRRLALLVNQAKRRHGPVFEGRFRSHSCDDPDHLRRAIAYVHNNALRKGLCEDVFAYKWQSHGWYCGQRPGGAPYIDATIGLNLFLKNPTTDLRDLRRDYLDYFAWRLEKDRCDQLDVPFGVPEPEAKAGDAYFREHFAVRSPSRPATRPDLRDHAALLLKRISPGTELDLLRTPYVSKELSRTRRELICTLIQHGYRGAKIATLLRVSGAVVSKCASLMRYAEIETKLKR